MKKNLSSKFKDASIRVKFTFMVIGTLVVMFLVSIYMYYNINRLSKQIDDIYAGNVKLNNLEDALNNVQLSLTEYLNTRRIDKKREHEESVIDYQNLVDQLNEDITDSKFFLMERNIKELSDYYLPITEKTRQLKDESVRQKSKVESYRRVYDEADKTYRYIRAHITSLNGQLFRDNEVTYEALSSAIRFLEVSSVLIFIILAIFDVFVVLLITRNITKPLHELARAADKVSEGKLDETGVVNVYAKDEVGVVTEAFNQMVSSIPMYLDRLKDSMEKERELVEKELMMEANLKEAHLKVLQAQINPHFLFNTLNAGAQLAMLEKSDRTYEYIQNVADFYRYNISASDEVKLADELRIVDTYIFILNVRFSGEINYCKEIESEEYLNVKLPCMVLQPIVENCINHGVRDIEREKHIYLSIYEEDGYVCINIGDNGVGIEQSVIDNLLNGKGEDIEDEANAVIKETDSAYEKVKKEDKKGNGLGLRNVIERLDLYFNGKSKFEIYSNGKDQGTEFVISIPCEDKVDE